jgi:3-phosphoglycerate kinase
MAASLRKLGLEDLDLNGKRVLMRVDFNVPIKGFLTFIMSGEG